MPKKLLTSSLLCSLAMAAYIALVALFFNNIGRLAGNKPDNILAPMLMLTLLVVSAAITGSLVLGKPLMLYLDGAKKDAIKHLAMVILWLFALLVILLLVLILRRFY